MQPVKTQNDRVTHSHYSERASFGVRSNRDLSNHILSDQPRCYGTVINCSDGDRDILKTSGKGVSDGKLFRDTRGGGTTVY